MNKRTWAIVTAAIVISGCATEETLVPTGGSRADGTVQLSYEYGLFQKPVVDMTQATQAAANSCATWGYTGAQPFGGQFNKCEVFNGYGNCLRMLVTVNFQCTGSPAAANR
jgi:hypothetical protein